MEQVLWEYKDNIDQEVRQTEQNKESSELQIFRFLLNPRVRLIAVSVGVLSTLMPWYLSATFFFDYQYINLFSGLFAANNLGLEFAALLFYVGLLLTSYKSTKWSIIGGIIMAIGAIIGSFSVQGFPGVGAGMCLGILVIMYAFLPAIILLVTMEEPDPIDK